MVPDHLRFGGGAADTTINPLLACYLLIAVVMILISPRGKAIKPFMVAFFTIPVSQVVVLGGLHFTALRILILAALARRATFRGRDKYPGGFNPLDWAVILWSISTALVFCIEFPEKAAVITTWEISWTP